MARLPDLGARRPVSRPGGGIQVPDLDPGYAEFAGLGRAATGASLALDDAKGDMEVAQAESAFYRAQIKAEQQILEGDHSTWVKSYGETVDGAAQVFASQISDPQKREVFLLHAGDRVVAGTARMETKARTKNAEYGRASLNDLINSNLDAVISMEDSREREDTLLSTSRAIDAALASGYIGPEDAVRLKRSAAQTYAKRRLDTLSPAEQLASLGVHTGPLPEDLVVAISAVSGSPEEEEWLRRTALLESGGDTMAVNEHSGAAGPFQFIPSTAADYGLEDPHNASHATRAALALRNNNARTLEGALGRSPSGGELYLAHQQGGSGAVALLSNRGENVVDVLADIHGNRDYAEKAVRQNGGSTKMTAGQFADMWINKYNGASHVDVVAGDPSLASYLPADDRAKIELTARRKLDAEMGRIQAEYMAGFQAYIDAVQVGADVPPVVAARYSDEALNASIPDPEERMIARDARDDAHVMGEMVPFTERATLDELKTYAVTLRGLSDGQVTTIPGMKRAPRAARMTELGLKAIQDEIERRLTDPAQRVLDYGELDVNGPGYARATLAEQERLGVPSHLRRVLPNAVAKGMVTNIAQAPEAERGLAVDQLSQQWGEDWPQVLTEMRAAGLPSATYHAALYADNPPISERIASLATTPMSELEQGLDQAEVKDLKLSVTGEMEDFRQVFEAGDPTGMAAVQMNELREIVTGLALQEFRQTGNASNSIENAIKPLIHDRYHILDGGVFQAYIPAEFDADRVEDGALAYFEEHKADIIPLGGDEGELEEIRRNRILNAPRRLVTNSDGTGLVMMVDADGRWTMVPTEDGPFEVSFEDAVKSAPIATGGAMPVSP